MIGLLVEKVCYETRAKSAQRQLPLLAHAKLEVAFTVASSDVCKSNSFGMCILVRIRTVHLRFRLLSSDVTEKIDQTFTI